MYQALKSLGVDTQFVIYPQQFYTLPGRALFATGRSGTLPGTTNI
jgi:hypothetical protein